MKNFIELKYHKNSKQEIVFENLDEIKESDEVVFRLKDGDITPLMSWLYYCNTNWLENPLIIASNVNKTNYDILYDEIVIESSVDHCHETWLNKISFFDSNFDKNNIENIYNILPKWNIPEDSAVLFLNKHDQKKYANIYKTFWICNLESDARLSHQLIRPKSKPPIIDEFINYKNISIIVPELHKEDNSCPYHINNINKVCKELKEKYGIESIELFVSHCFIDTAQIEFKTNIFDIRKSELCKIEKFNEIYNTPPIQIFKSKEQQENEILNKTGYIDKITTTNSTGILEVQKSERLEVVDVIEFFKD